jgi:thioredoxin 1
LVACCPFGKGSLPNNYSWEGLCRKLTKGNHVTDKPKVVILDFWAAWCGPCQALSPILDKVAETYPNVELVKIDVEDSANEELTIEYNVISIPKVVVKVDDKIVKTIVGAKPYPAIIADLEEWL